HQSGGLTSRTWRLSIHNEFRARGFVPSDIARPRSFDVGVHALKAIDRVLLHPEPAGYQGGIPMRFAKLAGLLWMALSALALSTSAIAPKQAVAEANGTTA